MDNQNIQSNTLTDTLDFFKRIGNLLLKGLDRVIELGLKVNHDTEYESEDGTQRFTIHATDISGGGKGKPAKVYLYATPLDESGKKFKFTLEYKGKQKELREKVMNDKAIENITYILEDWDLLGFENTDEAKKAFSSKRIQVTLQRVSAGSEDCINLVAINAAGDPTTALCTVGELIANDDFLEHISSDPVSFSILDEGEEFDIEPIEAVDTSDTYQLMLASTINTFLGMQCVRWNAKGEDFFRLRSMVDDYMYQIKAEMDKYAELQVETAGSIIDPRLLVQNDSTVATSSGFEYIQGVGIIQDLINNHVACLECLYCNCPADIQSKLDETIRYWKHAGDYVLKQILS